MKPIAAQLPAQASTPSKSSEIPSKFSEIVRKSVKGTEEFNRARWEKRNARLAKHEKKFAEILGTVFARQRSDSLALIKKAAVPDAPEIDPTKYQIVYLSLLKDAYTELVAEEGQAAAEEVSAGFAFRVGDPAVVESITSSIRMLGKWIDETTNGKIRAAFAQAVDEGAGTSAIMEKIQAVFDELEGIRLETIVRTETIRASNEASVSGWRQTGVVSAKEWWTAQDERVSPFDASLHWKVIALEEDFFKVGDVLEVDGQKLKIDYSDVPAPPLHPNCRCTLLPITK